MRNRLLLLAALAFAACTPAPRIAPVAAGSGVRTAPAALPHAAWTRSATIYEVNVRQFTPEGTFAASIPAWCV